MNPSSVTLNYTTKVWRRRETIAPGNTVHGSSEENINPVIAGMLDTLNAKLSSGKLAVKILSSKTSLKNEISRKCVDRSKIEYFK